MLQNPWILKTSCKVKGDHKRLRIYDSTYMKCPDWENPLRQKADWWLPGARRGVALCVQGFCLGWWKWLQLIRSWWWLHNSVNTLKITELCTLNRWILCKLQLYKAEHKKNKCEWVNHKYELILKIKFYWSFWRILGIQPIILKTAKYQVFLLSLRHTKHIFR